MRPWAWNSGGSGGGGGGGLTPLNPSPAGTFTAGVITEVNEFGQALEVKQGPGIPYQAPACGVGFGGSRCFLDWRSVGTYSEGSTWGIKLRVAGSIQKMWLEAPDGSTTGAQGATVVLRNKGVADLSGLTLTLAGNVTGGQATGSTTIAGTEEIIFAVDAPDGWGSSYFRYGFLFFPTP